MALVEKDLTVGSILLLGALVFLSTWPAMMNYCTLRKRNGVHIFLDYATGYFAFTAIVALTLGNVGADTQTFFEQIGGIENNWPCVLSALGGGAFLMTGNLTMQIALSMGVSLSVVLPIQSSFFEIISTTLNYLLQPEDSHASILFGGLLAFVVAIGTSTTAEILYKRNLVDDDIVPPKGIVQRHIEKTMSAATDAENASSASSENTSNSSTTSSEESDSVSAPNIPDRSENRSRKFAHRVVAGLLVAVAGGFAFGFFAPLFNIAVNDQFQWLREDDAKLTGLTANFYFAFSFWFFAHVANVPRMKASNTSFRSYCMDNDHRCLALATGCVCGLGNTLQFLGGMATSFAVCGVARAFPLISIIWGMALFGEFRKARMRVKMLLATMYISYLVATTSMMLSIKTQAQTVGNK